MKIRLCYIFLLLRFCVHWGSLLLWFVYIESGSMFYIYIYIYVNTKVFLICSRLHHRVKNQNHIAWLPTSQDSFFFYISFSCFCRAVLYFLFFSKCGSAMYILHNCNISLSFLALHWNHSVGYNVKRIPRRIMKGSKVKFYSNLIHILQYATL